MRAAGTVWSWGSAAWGRGCVPGPQAESPPAEIFFLGRVFSVLEASGCGKETGRQKAQPGVATPRHFPKLWPSSHLSFGHFFDGFGPLRGLVSRVILRDLCPGICLVRA